MRLHVMIEIQKIPKKEIEELMRISRGKSRRASECEHEGKINPFDGCEFCGETFLFVSLDLWKRLQHLEEFKKLDPTVLLEGSDTK